MGITHVVMEAFFLCYHQPYEEQTEEVSNMVFVISTLDIDNDDEVVVLLLLLEVDVLATEEVSTLDVLLLVLVVAPAVATAVAELADDWCCTMSNSRIFTL